MNATTAAYRTGNKITLNKENFSLKELRKQLKNNCFACTKIRLKIKDVLENSAHSEGSSPLVGRAKKAAALLLEILVRINSASETIFTLEQEGKDGEMYPLFSMEKWQDPDTQENMRPRTKNELLSLRDKAIGLLCDAIEELYVLEEEVDALGGEKIPEALAQESQPLPQPFPSPWEVWRQISLQDGPLHNTVVAPALESLSRLWSASDEAAAKERSKWLVLQQQITGCWAAHHLDKPLESTPLLNPLHIQLQQLLEGKGLRRFYSEGFTIAEMLLSLEQKKPQIGLLPPINEEGEKLTKEFSKQWNSSEPMKAEQMAEGFCKIFGEKFGWRQLPPAVTTFLFMEYLALWELVDYLEKDEVFCKKLAGNSFFFLLEKLVHSTLLGNVIENAPATMVEKGLKKMLASSITDEAIQTIRLSCMGLEKETPLQSMQWKNADRATEHFIKAIALYFLENVSKNHDIRKITSWVKSLLAYQQSVADYAKALTTPTPPKLRHLKRETVKKTMNELLSATLSMMICLAIEIGKNNNEKERELVSKIDALLKSFAQPEQPLGLLEWLKTLL